ncbi:hypothetical protein V501_00159 [Pseudogymnoascus sp. VKM F-4519 (FW-2642)]|nr:hypothetical protein V501_00159 [Pseudogymnoascus sp. VKM F-4519 (FW-2642)]
MRGARLKSLGQLFGSYQLAEPADVKAPSRGDAGPAPAIRGLRVLDGWQCLACAGGLTRNVETMKRHVSREHQQRPGRHKDSPLWQACRLQTFFAEKRLIRYFVVSEADRGGGDSSGSGKAALSPAALEEEKFFQQQGDDIIRAREDGKAAANVVQGFGSHRSAVMPWLQRTGIKDCLEGLEKEQIQASFSLPRKAEDEPGLSLILEVMDEILSEAHSWCFDGPGCMLTWPRQLALSRFHTATAGKARGFEPRKEPETRTPADSVQLTDEQASSWAGVIRGVEEQERQTLRDSLSVFYMAVICHEFGGSRYSSPLLGFYAMQSVAQLLIFHASASLEKAGHGNTLDRITEYCEEFLRPETETPMGEILSWRLLLFAVSKEAVGSHQAEPGAPATALRIHPSAPAALRRADVWSPEPPPDPGLGAKGQPGCGCLRLVLGPASRDQGVEATAGLLPRCCRQRDEDLAADGRCLVRGRGRRVPKAAASPDPYRLWSASTRERAVLHHLVQHPATAERQACAQAGTPRIGIAIWRQMTVTIVKTKFAADIACFDAEQPASEEAEEIDADIRAMTSQRNYSTWTANRAYANQQNSSFGNVWDGLIRRNLRASTLWKDFWGLDSLLGSPSKRKRSDLDVDGPQLLKRIARGVYRPRKKWSSAALLRGARQLYGDEALQWKSAMQERAMVTVMSGSEQVVVVLGTGEGKSMLFMLPSVLPDAGITILILPLTPHEARTAPLVFVSAEAAGTKAFRAYAYKLAATGELGRIVLDEAHFTVTASEYRAAMVDLALIRGVRTQFVYLTATLPPTLQAQFELQNNLVNPKIIRASTNRRNLLYMVERVAGPGQLLKEGARRAKDARAVVSCRLRPRVRSGWAGRGGGVLARPPVTHLETTGRRGHYDRDESTASLPARLGVPPDLPERTPRPGAVLATMPGRQGRYAICQQADPESDCQSCLYADIVMPLCYGIFCGSSAEEWLLEQFQQRFGDVDEFLRWCGRATSFGGGKAIWGVRVAAAALIQFELY